MEKLNEQVSKANKSIVESLKETGKERLANEKEAAAEQADKLANVVERATQELGRSDFVSIAGYANQLAATMKGLADKLRDSSIEDLVDETRRAARRNPELFLLGSIAIGVALSRFFKASEEQRNEAARTVDDDRHMEPARDTFAANKYHRRF